MVLHPVFSFPVMKIRIDRLIWHGCEYGKQQFTKLPATTIFQWVQEPLPLRGVRVERYIMPGMAGQ